MKALIIFNNSHQRTCYSGSVLLTLCAHNQKLDDIKKIRGRDRATARCSLPQLKWDWKHFFSERQIKISNKRLRASFVCAYTSSPPRPRSECVSFVLGFFLTPTSTLSWFFLKLLFCCFIYFFHRLILGVFQLRLFCKYEHFYFCLFINTRKKRFQISSFFSLLYRRTQEFGSSWFCCCLLSPSTGETLNNKQGECVLYWSLLFFWRVHGRTNVHADSR